MRLDKQMIVLILLILMFFAAAQKKWFLNSAVTSITNNTPYTPPQPTNQLHNITQTNDINSPNFLAKNISSIASQQIQTSPNISLQLSKIDEPKLQETSQTQKQVAVDEPKLQETTQTQKQVAVDEPKSQETSQTQKQVAVDEPKSQETTPTKQIYYQYEIQLGDSLWLVAKKNYQVQTKNEINACVHNILSSNPELKDDPDNIKPGIKIRLPQEKLINLTLAQEPDKLPPKQLPTYHIVKTGDTLSSLAIFYYNEPSALAKILSANPTIKNPNQLPVGLHLIIPQ